jgi:hypothetical protein
MPRHLTLQLRLTIGIAIFFALALSDLYKNGKSATRWREYLFLLTCVMAAMLYGALNDQISSRISWEYFFGAIFACGTVWRGGVSTGKPTASPWALSG